MSDRLARQIASIARYVDEAQNGFEAGFLSEAARKRALDSLNRAYNEIHDMVHDAVIAEANERWPDGGEARHAFFDRYEIPFDLHQVRDRHFVAMADYPAFHQVRDLIALRAEIKAAEAAKFERNPDAVKIEEVRTSIISEMEKRKAQFVEGMEIARLFNGLPVSVNAHWVYGNKGARYLRHFFYLRGKLTALNMIMFIAQEYEREQEAKK
jgi:hypothetical protein